MITLLYVLHFVVCIAIIVIVLLQADKGSGLAGAFGGGGSYAKFGDEGGFDFMGKLTTGVAVAFMILSLVISIYTKKHAMELQYQKEMQAKQVQSQLPVNPSNIPLSSKTSVPKTPASPQKANTK